MKTQIALFICLAALVSGCEWNDRLYDTYANDDHVEKCSGACDCEFDKGQCENRGKWNPASCRISIDSLIGDVDDKDSNEDSKNRETVCKSKNGIIKGDYCIINNDISEHDCNEYKGTWIKGYCNVSSADNCNCVANNANWHQFDVIDMGNGRYIKKLENGFRCGEFNNVIDAVSTGGCMPDDIKKYQFDFEKQLCRSGSQCTSISLIDGDNSTTVGLCNACGNGLAYCLTKEGEKCVSLSTDPKNCGKCGNACGEGTFCDKGVCRANCSVADGFLECYCSRDSEGNLLNCSEEVRDGYSKECLDPGITEICGIKRCKDVSPEWCPPDHLCSKVGDEYQCKCSEYLNEYKNDKVKKCLNPYNPESCGATDDSSGNICKNSENEECNGKACVCKHGFELCNDTYACANELNKCVSISDNASHCGKIGNRCDNNKKCVDYNCVCEKDENGNNMDGCFDESILNEVDFCGDNKDKCSEKVKNAPAVCLNGQCNYTRCNSNWLNCNGNNEDGCETAFSVDNCGGCNSKCSYKLQEKGENKCENGNCCIIGETKNTNNLDGVTKICCSNYELYKYKKNSLIGIVGRCTGNNHYGCFTASEVAELDTECWSKVN